MIGGAAIVNIGAPRCVAAELLAQSRLSGGTSRRDIRSAEFEVMAGRRARPRSEKARYWKPYCCARRLLRACRYRRARLAVARVLSLGEGESRTCCKLHSLD